MLRFEPIVADLTRTSSPANIVSLHARSAESSPIVAIFNLPLNRATKAPPRIASKGTLCPPPAISATSRPRPRSPPSPSSRTAQWTATLLQAAAVGDKLLGVSTDIAAAINERCDIILAGSATILFGGPVARGDLLTSDASGRAVTAAPAGGVNNRIIGIAMVSGVVGDIGQMIVSQGSAQG